MKEMTWKMERIVRFLKARSICHGCGAGSWVGPTEIGLKEFGYPYYTASSRISQTCKRMVAKGILARSERGHYRLVLDPPALEKG